MRRKRRAARMRKTRAHTDVHVINRARERLGVEFTTADIDAVIRMITNMEATPLYRESNTRTWWLVEYGGIRFKAVFSRGAILTVIGGDTLAPGEQDAVRFATP